MDVAVWLAFGEGSLFSPMVAGVQQLLAAQAQEACVYLGTNFPLPCDPVSLYVGDIYLWVWWERGFVEGGEC